MRYGPSSARQCSPDKAAAWKAPLAGLDENDRRRAAHAGVEIIDAGRESIESRLDDLRHGLRSQGTGQDGATIIYGLLRERLARPTADPAFTPIREIVFRHAMRTIPSGAGAVAGLPLERRKTRSLVAAAHPGARRDKAPQHHRVRAEERQRPPERSGRSPAPRPDARDGGRA